MLCQKLLGVSLEVLKECSAYYMFKENKKM